MKTQLLIKPLDAFEVLLHRVVAVPLSSLFTILLHISTSWPCTDFVDLTQICAITCQGRCVVCFCGGWASVLLPLYHSSSSAFTPFPSGSGSSCPWSLLWVEWAAIELYYLTMCLLGSFSIAHNCYLNAAISLCLLPLLFHSRNYWHWEVRKDTKCSMWHNDMNQKIWIQTVAFVFVYFPFVTCRIDREIQKIVKTRKWYPCRVSSILRSIIWYVRYVPSLSTHSNRRNGLLTILFGTVAHTTLPVIESSKAHFMVMLLFQFLYIFIWWLKTCLLANNCRCFLFQEWSIKCIIIYQQLYCAPVCK